MKTICFIETDDSGNIEWSEGCVAAIAEHFTHSRELVDKQEALETIKLLEKRISDMSWSMYPEAMGR